MDSKELLKELSPKLEKLDKQTLVIAHMNNDKTHWWLFDETPEDIQIMLKKVMSIPSPKKFKGAFIIPGDMLKNIVSTFITASEDEKVKINTSSTFLDIMQN